MVLNEQTNWEGLVLTRKILKFRFGHERHVSFYYFAHTETAKSEQKYSQ